MTRQAIAHLHVEDIDLHGQPGLVFPGTDLDDVDGATAASTAALLPALDPTPMGWKARQWLLGVDRHHLFDRAGNIGPTLWWDGEVVGCWAVTTTGEIRTAVLADRGAEADQAIADAAARLQSRLDGAAVTPAARTPLERALSQHPTR